MVQVIHDWTVKLALIPVVGLLLIAAAPRGIWWPGEQAGRGISRELPRGAGVVLPELIHWHYSGFDNGPGSATVTFYSNETTGTPCEVSFLIFIGKKTFASSWSVGDQNSPHGCALTVTNLADRGLDYSLQWCYRIAGGTPSAFVTIPGAVVTVPDYGGGPTGGGF